MYDFHSGTLPAAFSNYFTAVNKRHKRHKYNIRLASRSSYTLPPIRTNYGKLSIKFQGAKLWNSLSEETKSLHWLALKKTLKGKSYSPIDIQYFLYYCCSQYLIHKYINSFIIACHYSCIVNIIVFCKNYYCFFFLSSSSSFSSLSIGNFVV